jgi:hypothetical protein
MSEVASWPVVAKTSLNSNDYIPVTGRKRLQALSLFASMATTGVGGQSLFKNITNINQLNFKGILSSTTGMLSVTTVSDNISLAVLPAGIDLDLCDNSTSAFLSVVDLATDTTGTLPVTSGGTGLATLAKGAMLYASANDTLSAFAPLTNGQLYVGNSVSGVPTIATLTAGTNITVTNGPGTITIAANLSTLTSVLDTDIYNINLNAAAGASWISGDGTSEGMYVDAAGRAFIGDTTPTLYSLTAQLTLGGASTIALMIGNPVTYAARSIKMVNPTGGTAGATLTVEGASGGTGNQVGGIVEILAGAGTGSGTGGAVQIKGGPSASGDSGTVEIGTMKGASFQKAIVIDKNANVHINDGFLGYTLTPQSLVGPGAVNVVSQITHITTTGTDAYTLTNGVEGQTKFIIMVARVGNATLTPTSLGAGTTITFNAVGDSVHLLYTNSAWHIVGYFSIVVA